MSADTADLQTSRARRLPSEVLRPRILRAFDFWLESTKEINAQLIAGVRPDPDKMDEDLRRMRRFLDLVFLANKLESKMRQNHCARPLDKKLPT